MRVANILIILLGASKTTQACEEVIARKYADERSYDVRPIAVRLVPAFLQRLVIRPPAGWQAS